MIGLFDSGSGGINTVRYIKEISDTQDLVYLIDRTNAPYGTRSKKELISITERNIKELSDRGAERVLIACCTASTVYPYIAEEYKKISIPIIEAAANEAKKLTRTRRIGVIATKRTVASHAFKKSLPGISVTEHPLSELVPLIDGGLCDKTVTEDDVRMIEAILYPVLKRRIDTLVLGCTHFPSLRRTISEIATEYGVKETVDTALVGARLIVGQ